MRAESRRSQKVAHFHPRHMIVQVQEMLQAEEVAGNLFRFTSIIRLATVLYGYFAVIGDEEQSQICCLCGFIAEADDWGNFDHAYGAFLSEASGGFDAAACLCGTGIYETWSPSRRQALLARISSILARSDLAPIGAVIAREHFSGLSPIDRSVLAAEGIGNPLDLMFYDLTERMLSRIHEESEKISLIFDQRPNSAAHRYLETFNKHISRYLVGPHLMGTLALADATACSPLQAANLLAEALRLVQIPESLSEMACDPLPIPGPLQEIASQISREGRFDTAKLKTLAAKLRNP